MCNTAPFMVWPPVQYGHLWSVAPGMQQILYKWLMPSMREARYEKERAQGYANMAYPVMA